MTRNNCRTIPVGTGIAQLSQGALCAGTRHMWVYVHIGLVYFNTPPFLRGEKISKRKSCDHNLWAWEITKMQRKMCSRWKSWETVNPWFSHLSGIWGPMWTTARWLRTGDADTAPILGIDVGRLFAWTGSVGLGECLDYRDLSDPLFVLFVWVCDRWFVELSLIHIWRCRRRG